VKATANQVLVFGPPGHEHIFKAYYSSTCGGISNPAEGLEPQEEQVAALAGGVVCTDCAGASRYRWPTVQISKAAAFSALGTGYPKMAALGSLEKLRPQLPGTSWGRVEWFDIVGHDGRYERLRADDFRLAMLRYGPPESRGLFSMNCTVKDLGSTLSFEDGRGFGHSVGLCQYGAQGKALRGMKYYEILYIYYPGAKIMKLP
jgi:stage II sporulation protein D